MSGGWCHSMWTPRLLSGEAGTASGVVARGGSRPGSTAVGACITPARR